MKIQMLACTPCYQESGKLERAAVKVRMSFLNGAGHPKTSGRSNNKTVRSAVALDLCERHDRELDKLLGRLTGVPIPTGSDNRSTVNNSNARAQGRTQLRDVSCPYCDSSYARNGIGPHIKRTHGVRKLAAYRKGNGK